MPRPANDLCADARLIPTSTVVRATTSGAGHELAVGPGLGRCLEGDQLGTDVFYRLSLSAGQRVTLELRASHDTALYVLGPGEPSDVCARPVEACVAGSDQGAGAETVEFTAPAAGTYTIVVDAFWFPAQGPFELEVRSP